MNRSAGEKGLSALLHLLDARRWTIFYQFLMAFLILAMGGVILLNGIIPEMSNRIATIIQFLVAAGTISLAAATFYNIQQTNLDLRMRKREREKPLAIDELSNVTEPAIQAVSRNLEILKGEEGGFDWAYVQDPRNINVTGIPRSAIPIRDIAALNRLNEQNRGLYQQLVEHDEMIRNLGSISQEIGDKVSDAVERQLESVGYSDDDYSQSDTVFVSAMLNRTEHFGESHEMYDFWEENREELFEILDREAGNLVDDLEARIPLYEAHCEDLVTDLQTYKTHVQHEYGISSDEINVTDPFERRHENFR